MGETNKKEISLAPIQNYLDKIKTAVLGRDVRQSIYDSIKQCYLDGSAGAVDLDARDAARLAEARMDSFMHLPVGSTTGDANFDDMCIGAYRDKNGKSIVYESPGAAIRGQILATRTIEVTDKQPTRENTQVWINPNETTKFLVPEILDDEVSNTDSWSSYKISKTMAASSISWIEHSCVGSDGRLLVEDVISDRKASSLIPCPAGITVTFAAETNHKNISGLTFYDVDEKVLQTYGNLGTDTSQKYTVTAPEGTKFLRLSDYIRYGENWYLEFSENPTFPIIKDLVYQNGKNDCRFIRDTAIYGAQEPKYAEHKSDDVVFNDDGTITVPAGGYYFVGYRKQYAYGGNTYISLKYNLDRRIEVRMSNNGKHVADNSPSILTEKFGDYEILKLESMNECMAPYVSIRFDNREFDTDIIISEIHVVNGNERACNGLFYISPTGSDSNVGSLEAPLATVDRALLLGGTDICMLSGVYEQQIDLSKAVMRNISIRSYEKDGRVIFRAPGSVISETETKFVGASNVYTVSMDAEPDSGNVWFFQDGVNDQSTMIEDNERHPLQRGYEFRCSDTKIVKYTGTDPTPADVISALDRECVLNQKYMWYYDAGTLYFTRPQPITESNPLCGSFGKTLFLNANRSHTLSLSGIETKYMSFNVSRTAKSVVTDCRSSNVFSAGAFVYDEALSCEFVRCEAVRCYSGNNGDGFNAHSKKTGDPQAKQTTVTFVDCWSHDNSDDGYSDHERSETTVIGGLYEYNGKAGLTPSYGSHCTCHNVYSRKNYAGFYYGGEVDAAEGGKGGQMCCYNCIAESNDRGGTKVGFKVDGEGNSILLINCMSIGHSYGYYMNTASGVHKLIDCKTRSDDTPTYALVPSIIERITTEYVML